MSLVVSSADPEEEAHGNGALTAAAYDAFAPFYDTLTDDADYDWWWSALLPLAETAGLPGKRVLDVACGTGKSLEPLLARGWIAVGVDVAPRMLTEARRKLGHEVQLATYDMRALPRLGEFDLVCALDASINCLLDERQLVEAFLSFRLNLAPGGIVVFDVATIAAFRAPGALVHQEPGRVLMVETSGDARLQPGATTRTDFVVLEQRDGSIWRRRRSSHLRRHHPEVEVRGALLEAGLELVGVHGQTYKTIGDTLDELAAEKAVYVARAPR